MQTLPPEAFNLLIASGSRCVPPEKRDELRDLAQRWARGKGTGAFVLGMLDQALAARY